MTITRNDPEIMQTTSIILASISKPSALQIKQATELLEYVERADYVCIQKLWEENPILMFVEIPDKQTTPLKRALFNLDTWTWKPFYEWLETHRQDLAYLFLQQHAEQKQHVDLKYLKPLHDAYVSLVDAIDDWCRLKEGVDALDTPWRNVFKLQKRLLPWHMVKEMCCEGQWTPESMFSVKSVSPNERVLNRTEEYCNKFANINSYHEFRRDFGRSFGIVRGEHSPAFMLNTVGEIFSSRNSSKCTKPFKDDMYSIERLCNRRTLELSYIPVLPQQEEIASEELKSEPANKLEESVAIHDLEHAEIQSKIESLSNEVITLQSQIKSLKQTVKELTDNANKINKPHRLNMFRN